MTTSKLPSYIVKRPSGIHFRIKVPPDIQAFVGKQELRRSLTSLSHRSAHQEAQRLAVIAKEYFYSVRQGKKIQPTGKSEFWEEQPIRQSDVVQFRSKELPGDGVPALTVMIKAYSEEQVQVAYDKFRTFLRRWPQVDKI